MTGRERLQAILSKQPTDRLPWTTLVDNATLSGLPEALRGNHGLDFYRHLGCDILLLDGWNTPYNIRSPRLVWPEWVRIEADSEGPRQTVRWHTPKGTLTGISERNCPVRHPVTTLDEVRIYRAMWEGARFEPVDDSAAVAAIDAMLGDDGVATRFWGPSTIPRLLEQDMGTEAFYYLLADYPDAMRGLIGTIHEREVEAFDILAATPWTSVTLVENTSTYYISPAIYEEFNMPHQRDFVERVRRRGRTAILHMCGHVKNLLPLIRETGCDGIHFLTPPPTGDCPWETALDVLGDDLIVFGCLPPSVFVMEPLHGIRTALDRMITPRLREANFVLSPTADGICVGLERFLAVKEWMMEPHTR